MSIGTVTVVLNGMVPSKGKIMSCLKGMSPENGIVLSNLYSYWKP